MRTEYDELLVRKDGPIVEVQINRPEARNAMTFKMEDEFIQIFNECADDDEVKVVTVTGVGPIFSAGHDLKEVAEGYATTGAPSGWDPHRVPQIRRAWYFQKPIIAGVHGYVGPIAQDFLASCDFVIAAEGTRFSFEQTRMGGGSPGGTPLVFLLPLRVWKKMMMMGGWMTAEQALEMHYISRVVPPEQVQAETRRWAEEIARIPTRQVQAAKAGIHRQVELMGLANMEMIGNRFSGHGSEEDMAFFRTVMEIGLKEALKSRDMHFDQEIARV